MPFRCRRSPLLVVADIQKNIDKPYTDEEEEEEEEKRDDFCICYVVVFADVGKSHVGSKLAKGLVAGEAVGAPDGRRAPVGAARALGELLALDAEYVLEYDLVLGRGAKEAREVDELSALVLGGLREVGLLGPGGQRLARLLLVVRVVLGLEVAHVVVVRVLELGHLQRRHVIVGKRGLEQVAVLLLLMLLMMMVGCVVVVLDAERLHSFAVVGRGDGRRQNVSCLEVVVVVVVAARKRGSWLEGGRGLLELGYLLLLLLVLLLVLLVREQALLERVGDLLLLLQIARRRFVHVDHARRHRTAHPLGRRA